jgi:GT2 family glycosyltransferase
MESHKTTNPVIGIVTVLFNSSEVIQDFFKSLEEQVYKDFILYVVDNKSTDNSLEIVKELSQKVGFKTHVIAEQKNGGIAKGNNIGIKMAIAEGCEYIVLSNNDILLFPDTIKNLYTGLIEEKAAIAAPKILFFDSGKIWYAGGRFSKLSGLTPHKGYGEEDNGQYDIRSLFIYSPTCFCLIHKSAIDKVGFFDENYFVYFDDSDFMFRAEKLGIKKIYIPESKLYHKVSSTTGGSFSDFSLRYTYRNLTYFALKQYNLLTCFGVFSFQIIHYFFRKKWNLNNHQRKIVRKAYVEGFYLYRNNYRLNKMKTNLNE